MLSPIIGANRMALKHFVKMSFHTASQRGSLTEGRCDTSRQEAQVMSGTAACASLLVSAHPVAMNRVQRAGQ